MPTVSNQLEPMLMYDSDNLHCRIGQHETHQSNRNENEFGINSVNTTINAQC